MKLLFVSNLFPDEREPTHGLDNATLLRHLSRRAEIRVVALRPTLPFASRAWTSRAVDRAFDPLFVPALYVPKVGSLFNHRLAARALREPLRELQKRFAFDVVLSSWIYPDSCAISMLSRDLCFPFVAIAQGSDVHQYLRFPVRRRIIREALPRASAIITRSGELARLLAQIGIADEKLQTVYNGIDFERFRPGDRVEARRALGLPLAEKIILAVGNLLPIKNPLLLVKAHALLCEDPGFAGTRLILVGAGPLSGDVRALADTLGHGAQVLLAGRQDAETVARHMQAADLLCLPSDNEGVPNVILEAFACGLPVVASRVGGIPEVQTGDFLGRLIAPGNAEALRDALRDVLQVTPDREAIHRHARQFSWEKTAERYEDLLGRAARIFTRDSHR